MSRTVAELIGHPERLDKDSLYGLRELVARYPYYQAARLLFLKNLFLLHDDTFGEELRKAAGFVADRRVLFDMVEGHHYEIHEEVEKHPTAVESVSADGDRTQTLIDSFLKGVGEDDEEMTAPRRKPTVADATTNYVAFLLDMDDIAPADAAPAAAEGNRAQALLDGFLQHGADGIVLQDELEYTPDIPDEGQESDNEEDYFTETLAKIYIKQGRYEKAMEIIRKLNLNYPKKKSLLCRPDAFLAEAYHQQKV